jgi:hypothetical protein
MAVLFVSLMLIRATYDEHTLTVYQAYAPNIVGAAVAQQNLAVPAFKVERMTWIKPSFLWMMYRSGWPRKHTKNEYWLCESNAPVWTGPCSTPACPILTSQPMRALKRGRNTCKRPPCAFNGILSATCT